MVLKLEKEAHGVVAQSGLAIETHEWWWVVVGEADDCKLGLR